MKRVILIAIGTLLLASTVSGIIDTNINGLSDLWERAYNDEQLFAETFDPEADADADGWTNAQEAAAGTDPCASSPPDGIVRPETVHIPAVYGGLDENGIPVLITPEVITVTWPTIAGKQYTLLFSPDLSEQSWVPIGAPFIGNGNDTIYNFEINTTTTCFWRVAVTDVDTDGDGLLDSEEYTLGSSRYLADTDGDGLNDAAAHAAGKNPAGDGTDADGDGIPDNQLYSVVFEIQQESLHMPYGVGFEDFYGTDNSHRYLTYKSSEEYSVSDSPRYTSVTDGSQVWTSTYLNGGAITADGQPVSQTEGTTFSDWKSGHQLSLGEDEYIDDDPTETTVAGPTITATEIVTTTTDTTTWKVKRHVPGNPQGQLVRSGTETIVVTERFKLTNSVTYPEFWEEHVKARSWTVYDPDTYGSLNGVAYSRTVLGDVQTAENVREIFRNGNIDIFGRIADPGTSYTSDYGSDTRLKRVRWRWVRFNPLNPFDYEYTTPPLSYRLNFHFLVLQNEYLNHREWQGSNTPITDVTKAKAVIEIECVGDHGTGDWEEIPLATFNAHRIEDPVNLADIDFSKWGGTCIWFQSQVDLDWIKPGTENDEKPMELAATKEDTEGEVVNVNWDDDDNSEGDGGHGILVFKNDYDDTAANPDEDDMIQLKLRSIGAGYKARLKYDNSFMKIWRNDDRTNEVVSEETEIELHGDQTVYLEGKKLTAAETPQVIEMQIKLGSDSYVAGDCVNLQVATPVVTLFAKHLPTEGNGSNNLAKQLHKKKYLGARRRDDRNNTVILKGENQQGQTLWYSIDMFDLFESFEGHLQGNKPKITVRSPYLDKELKMALSLEGAHVYCNGHSNFGLEPNFTPNDTSTTSIDDYCNLSGGPLGGVTGIILKSNDPRDADFGGNPMLNPDHGGEDFALRPQDIVPQVTNYKVPVPDVLKFNGTQVNGDVLAVGSVLTPQPPLADGTIYHYEQNGEHQNYVTVVKSSGDKPVLRYKSCFMAGCNTGRAFSQTLNHGVLIYTIDESYAVTGGRRAQIDNDFHTARYSWDITHHVRLLTEGKSWQEIVSFLNQNQYFKPPHTSPETPDNFKFESF